MMGWGGGEGGVRLGSLGRTLAAAGLVGVPVVVGRGARREGSFPYPLP